METIVKVLTDKKEPVFEHWTKNIKEIAVETLKLMTWDELEQDAENFMQAVTDAVRTGEYGTLSEVAAGFSRSRAGFKPSEAVETVKSMFALKDTISLFLADEVRTNPDKLTEEINTVNHLIDQFGLKAFETYMEIRSETILQQQKTILELSTPVLQIWEGIVGLPIIGAVDAARSQQIMDALLTSIIDNQADTAIIDITGIGIMDTMTAANLLKTIRAVKLLGSDCILTGVNPQVAQTMVKLEVEFEGIITKSTLSDGIEFALRSREKIK